MGEQGNIACSAAEKHWLTIRILQEAKIPFLLPLI